MDQYTAISKLRRLIARTEQSWVISALKVDPLIWEFLCSSNLLELKKKDTGSLGNLRTPFNLACISMGLENSFDTRKSSFYGLPSELQAEAVKIWEMHFCTDKEIESLKDAGLLAFLFLDKTSRGQTWETVFENLSSATGNVVNKNWKTIFGILYSIVDPPDNLLSAIIASFKTESALEAVCHAILMQPQPLSSHEEIFLHLFHSLSLQQQITCLKITKGYGYSQLVTKIGRKILASQPERVEDYKNGIPLDTLKKDPEKINTVNSLVEILDLIGESNLAREILSMLTITLNEMVKNVDCKKQSLELENTESIDKKQLPEKGITRILFSILETAQLTNPDEQKKKEIINLTEKITKLNLPSYEFLEPTITKQLIEKTLNAIESLGYADIYFQLLESMLTRFPDNDEILKRGINFAERVNNRKRAIELSNMFLIAHPEDLDLKVKLANLLESEGDFTQAYSERLDVLDDSITPDKEFQTKTAQLAFKLSEFSKAESICSDILGQDLENVEILSIRGISRLRIGLDLLAENDLKHVVLLNPQNENAWTHLIELSEKQNDEQKKERVIKDAFRNLPNSAFINHQIAKKYIKSNSFTEALSFLRVANQNADQNIECVLDYANTLEQLGLHEEEKQFLENLDSQLAKDPRVMRLSARSLMRQGKYSQAVDQLVPSLDLADIDDDIYLEFAEAITGAELVSFSQNKRFDKCFLEKISNHLEKLLQNNDQDFRIRFFNAQLQIDLDKPCDAFNLIQKLSFEPESRTGRWNGSIQACLGRAALENGDKEMALTLLREANLIQPKNPAVQKHLARAYLENDLLEEAAETGRQIIDTDPEDLERLEWYSILMKNVGDQKEAIQGYEKLFNTATLGQRFAFPLMDALIADSQFIRSREVLEKIAEFSDLDGDYYKKAAQYAIMIQDPFLANELLGKSLEKNPNDLESIALKVTVLRRMESYEDAVAEINRAIVIDEKNAFWLLLRSEVSTSASKDIDSLSDLLNAQKLIEQATSKSYWSFVALRTAIQDESELAAQIGYRLLETGRFAESFIQFRKALQYCPDNIEYRYQALWLADGLLFEDEFNQIAEPTEVFRVANDCTKLSFDEKNAIAGIYGFLAQHSIDKNENNTALNFINTGKEFAVDNNDLQIADTLCRIRNANTRPLNLEISLMESSSNMPIAYPMVLSELYHWKSALEIARKNACLNKSLPKVNTILARIIINELEYDNLRSEFGAKSIVLELGEKVDQLIAEANDNLEQAMGYTASLEIRHLSNRLNLLGKVKQEDARNFARGVITPEEMAALASAYRRSGMLGDFENAIAQYPKFPLLMLQKAISCMSSAPDVSLDIAEKIVEVEPDNDLIWVLIAKLLANGEKYAEAIQAIEKAIDIKSDESTWHSLCAEWAKYTKNSALEIRHLTKSLENQPLNFAYRTELGKAFINAGMPERVIELWRSADSINTKSIERYLQLAQASHMQSNDTECLMHLKEAISAGGNSSEVNYRVGELLFKCGEPRKAYDFAKRAAIVDPKDPKAIVLLAKIIEIRNCAKDALTLINKSLSSNVHSSEMVLEKARLVRKISGEKAATEVYEFALNLDPENGIIHAELAECLYNLGDLEDAKTHAFVALNKNHNRGLLNALIGKIFQVQGHLDAAIPYYISAIALSPTTLDHYLTLCQIYQMRRDFQNALKTCRKAIEILPDEIQPYLIAGQILKDGKDYCGAEAMIRKAQALEPENLAIRRQLGAIIALNMVMTSQEVSSAL